MMPILRRIPLLRAAPSSVEHVTSLGLLTLAALFYSAVAVVLTFPLIVQLDAAVPSDLGDPVFSTWILWWNSVTVPYTGDWWNAPSFFPMPDSLALSEHLLGLSLFATPVIWLSGTPQLGYNIAFLLTFVLCGLAGYLLGLTVTRRPTAAYVLGLAYTLAPYRVAQLSHIQILASFWMPLALAGLHKYVEERRVRWLALFGVSTLLQSVTNGYYLFFFPILIIVWLLWFLPPTRQPRAFVVASTVLVTALLPVLPVLLRYRTVHQRLGLRRLFEEVLQYSADITALVRGSPDLSFWGAWLPPPAPEASLFPGLTLPVLVGAGIVMGLRAVRLATTTDNVKHRAAVQRLRAVIGLTATLVSLAAISRVILGPWSVNLFGLAISVSRISKPFSSALLLWLIFWLTGPAGRHVLRVRSLFAFYVSATVLMWLLSFGPDPTFLGEKLIYWPPYRWLSWVPGFESVRVPARFAMLATLCLAVAGSLAFARLFERVSGRRRILLTTLVVAGLLMDGWRTVPLAPPPAPSVIPAHAEAGGVLELPFGDVARDLAAMYRSMGHRHPVVNGYSGYFPQHYAVLQSALAAREADVLEVLRERGVRHVVVFDDGDLDGGIRTFVNNSGHASFVRASNGQSHYQLAPLVPSDLPRTPRFNVPIAEVRASTSAEISGRMIDRNIDTFWSTGRAQTGLPDEEILIDLGVTRPVSSVVLLTGRTAADYPRELLVESSADGITWLVSWRGRTAAKAFDGSLDDPIRRPIRLDFDSATVRYLRLRQLGTDSFYFWSIAEIDVGGQ